MNERKQLVMQQSTYRELSDIMYSRLVNWKLVKEYKRFFPFDVSRPLQGLMIKILTMSNENTFDKDKIIKDLIK